MRSITTFDLQYAHRFYGFQGEAQYLHGHTGTLTIEVEDTVEEGVNMVYPCNEIQKVAWSLLKNFDHALVLREDDPLLPAILDVYEKQGIKNGHPQNKMKGEAFKTELATAYPDARLVVTKETMTVEGMIKIVYDLYNPQNEMFAHFQTKRIIFKNETQLFKVIPIPQKSQKNRPASPEFYTFEGS